MCLSLLTSFHTSLISPLSFVIVVASDRDLPPGTLHNLSPLFTTSQQTHLHTHFVRSAHIFTTLLFTPPFIPPCSSPQSLAIEVFLSPLSTLLRIPLFTSLFTPGIQTCLHTSPNHTSHHTSPRVFAVARDRSFPSTTLARGAADLDARKIARALGARSGFDNQGARNNPLPN